ncbi:MAG: VanW family protein [Candidatus Roizmanbacteria bacterium]|nr:MAG: VanW family protein [Candidatus Roizmanbacteria bacterium]
MIPKKEDNHTHFLKYSILLFVSLLIFFVVLTQYIINQEKGLKEKIYPNVFLDGNNVGGKLKSEVAAEFKEKNQKLKSVDIIISYKENTIATLSAEKLNLHSNGEEIIERAYLIGRSSHGISRVYQKITSLFKLEKYNFYSQIAYDKDQVDDFINTVKDQYNKPAKNALFKFEDGKVSSFRQEEKGLKINTDKFFEDFDEAIINFNNKPTNKTIKLTADLIEPEITLKNINNFGIEELIAEGKSDYTHSIPERIHNLTLASSKFNGVLIPKDKEFSFNDVLGDVSALTGYKPAYIIKEGKTVLGDGGGVCQVSTTMFRAALNAGLPILARTAHAYRVSYYENDSKPGFDATVFSPSPDLKIKNDTPAAILIMTEIDKEKNILRFKLFGKKDGRNIEISSVKVTDEQPPPPALYQDDPTQKKGVVKQVDFPAWGALATFHYKVSKGSEITFEKEFTSYFKPWQAVYLVGTAD